MTNSFLSQSRTSAGVLLFANLASGCVLAEPIGTILDDDDIEITTISASGADTDTDGGDDLDTDDSVSTSGVISATETDLFPSTSFGSDEVSESGKTSESTSGGDDMPIVAIDENFDDWSGDDPRFLLTRPEASEGFADNNTVQTFDGRDCLYIHAPAADNAGYGYSVEFQLLLESRTDMSGEDFQISFDVYVPAETANEETYVQFGFYELTDLTPIYSMWHATTPDTWQTVTANVSYEEIAYSAFANNPGDWIFDSVRLMLIQFGEGAAEGLPASFCVDNLVVTNAPQ